MALLRCKDVAFAYEGRHVVEHLDLEVEPGAYLCIVGENGSGKSTLLKGLVGLKQPSEGHIELGDGLKRTEIGYLPQQEESQKDFPASVWEVVLSGCLNSQGAWPIYRRETKRLAQEKMELLDILPLQKRCFRDLSGGQKQRVLLARALCATKKILILDEPMAGLDPAATSGLYETLTRLNKDEGIAIVMVSHDIGQAVLRAKTVLYLGTHTKFFGTVEAYMAATDGRLYFGGGE